MKQEIIFQVNIDREKECFELVKTEVNDFETAAFIVFLESYVLAMKRYKVDELVEDYNLEYGREE